jgi:hypothetical protein
MGTRGVVSTTVVPGTDGVGDGDGSTGGVVMLIMMLVIHVIQLNLSFQLCALSVFQGFEW